MLKDQVKAMCRYCYKVLDDKRALNRHLLEKHGFVQEVNVTIAESGPAESFLDERQADDVSDPGPGDEAA